MAVAPTPAIPLTTARNMARLRDFVGDFAQLLGDESGEPALLERGGRLLADLVEHDDWLPDEYAAANSERYQQYLLHCDSRERFSVVSFVWGPGQITPIHDHRVWSLVGVLRGAEQNETFARDARGLFVSRGSPERLRRGAVTALSPTLGDVHRVANGYFDRVSVSIHVYGANIGAVERATYDAVTGKPTRFISGYANRSLPNLWDRSGSL